MPCCRLCCVLLFVTCARTAPTASSEIPFVEKFTMGGDTTSPLIIAIHGRGDTPESFADVFNGFPGCAEVALPRGFTRVGLGFSWFDAAAGADTRELADAITAVDEKLWPAIAKIAHGRKVIVMGFSQGGVLSYALAARHPDDITAAFPIAGQLPSPLYPAPGSRAAPIWAMHGTTDPRIDIRAARAAIAAFQAQKLSAELHEYEGIGHTISEPMQSDLFKQLHTLVP